MRYLSDFLRHSWDVSTLATNDSDFLYVCQYVWLLISLSNLDKGISPVLDEISSWNFWTHSWDVGTLFLNNSEFYACLSVCLFSYFLTKIRQRKISSSGWDISLELFGDIPEVLVHWFKIILNFCLSVSLFVA